MNPNGDPLSELRDIVEPAGVSGWPPAPGWWLLGVLVLLLLAWLFWVIRRQRARARHWSRTARASLEALAHEHNDDDRRWLGELAVLVRRIALASAPRSTVAPLTGEAWLSRLDALAGSDAFSRGVGRRLIEGPWQREVSLSAADRAALIDLTDSLIRALHEREGRT